MFRFFQAFLTGMKAGFARIARATKHELTMGDLHNDAWVIAMDIGERRGKPIDFSDPEDQDLVMAALYVENVKRGDWKMRHSLRIDQEAEGEGEGATKLADRLPARASSNPLVSLLTRESALQAEEMLAASFSQATAFVMVFVRFKNNREKVCAYLVISGGTLARRVDAAGRTVRIQPSLFDRIERISEDFMPTPGKQYLARVEDHRGMAQRSWQF